MDDACPDGYSRFYQGSNCAGTQPWACDCEDGVCAKCCREVVQDDGAWTCTHMPQNPALPPPMPPPSPSPPPPPQPPRPFDAEYCTELGGTDYGS